MNEVLLFTPKQELDALDNLEGFITMCRERLTVFGADLAFDAHIWDVTKECARKGQGTKRERITFCTLTTAGTKCPEPMSSAFRSFAQAYIRYMQGMRPVVGLGFRMAALRALEAALTENGAERSPVKADTGIFNRAAQLLHARFSEGAAYRIGIQLQMVADFLATNRLTVVPLRWHNSIKRPAGGTRVGKEFDEQRASKLPSPRALEVLPKVFRLAVAPADILVSSIAAILCSAPDRINEVLTLPVDCEVNLAGAYGIRWWPAKEADPMVKWVIPSMSSVVQEALGKIRKETDAARKVASWYEANPTRMYLPANLERLRDHELLSMQEVGKVLWGRKFANGSPHTWCKENSIPLEKQGRIWFAPFAQVESVVLAMLPSNFPLLEPDKKLKYSEALCVVQRNLFHRKKATYVPVIEPIVIQHINDGLGARSEHGTQSIFDSLGFTDDTEKPIRMTTHQFRHYLNTLAQAGGLSQLDIAKWSGRRDIRQNEAYDHVSADEMVQRIRNVIGDEERMFGPLASIPKNTLIPRDEFARLKIPTAHTTDFGFCVHDYSMVPCQHHRDCISCEEHVCIKGDEAKWAKLHTHLKEAQKLLADAEEAVQKGYIGGDRWMEHHQLTTERLYQLCEILDNPDVPVGAVIQLSGLQIPPQISQAEEQPLALTPPSSVEEMNITPSLDLLRNLLRD
ncbi:integrase [Pseudogulbenkiania ferrooxidans]|uniref:Integrase family protein n=1 Tax=Pseudogulbenkiania ferrooxidans 2002 TaxID=279714 RepID=B9Z715_9NEIS|nr:integrase [Pseudogulbenkiania ferrooxidans]EEG07330.1 integrase family protein [Pseudogulbenkiania ferrooxidans 2002]